MRGWRVKDLLEGGVEGRLVFFDGEKVVSSMFHDEDSGGFGLSVEGIEADRRTVSKYLCTCAALC